MKRVLLIVMGLLAVPIIALSQESALTERSFSKLFIETRFMVGNGHHKPEYMEQINLSVGAGISVAYVPNRWGFYGLLQAQEVRGVGIPVGLCGGAVYRLTREYHWVDVQSYGGLAIGPQVGLDVGFRFAPGAKNGRKAYSLFSGTVGMQVHPDTWFFSMGLSFGIDAGIGISVLTWSALRAWVNDMRRIID